MSSRWSQALRNQQISHDLDPYLEAAGYGGQLQTSPQYNYSGTRAIEEPEPPFSFDDLLRDSDDDENTDIEEDVAEDEDEIEPAEQQTQTSDASLARPYSKRHPTKAGGHGSTPAMLQAPKSRKDSGHPSYQPYKPTATPSTFARPLASNGEPDQDQTMKQSRATRKNKAGIDQIPPVAPAENDDASGNQPDAEDANGDDPDAALSEDDDSEPVSYWDSLGLPPLAAGAKHPNRIPAEIPNDDFEEVYKKKPNWIKKILRAINTAQTFKDPKNLSAKKKKLNRFCRKQIAELQAKPDLYDRVDTMVMNVIFIHREGFFPDTEVNGRPALDLDVEGDMTCTERMEKLVAAIASEAVLALCIVLGADMTRLLLRPTMFAIGDEIRVPGLEEWEDDEDHEESDGDNGEDGAEDAGGDAEGD